MHQLLLAGFSVLLILALFFLLKKKLSALRNEVNDDDGPDAGTTPAVDKPVMAQQSAVQVSEPAPFLVKQKNTELALPSVAENYSGMNAILNSLSDIIFEYDEDKVCINVWYNKLRAPMVEPERYIGKSVSDSLNDEKAKLINDAIDFVSANGQSTTVELFSFFGLGRWFSSHISPVFDADGNFTGRTTSVLTDISEQKKNETELKEKQQQLVEAQKIARLGQWWYDLKLKQTSWSENLYALLGIKSLPKNSSHFDYYISCVQADDRRGVYQFFNDVTGKIHQHNEHKIVIANGDLRYFRILRGEPFKDGDGNITCATGIIQDITENRVIERTIKKSQAELLETQTVAKIGNWKWYTGQKSITWSDEVYHIYEAEPINSDADISHFKLLLNYAHPDDKGPLLNFLKKPVNLRHTSFGYRIITPNGRLKHISIIIAKIKENDDGTIRSVIGTLQDITDRKTAEISIRKTEDSYKLVLETIKLAAVSLDKSGTIIFCNKHLANLLGYQQNQMVGLKWHEHFIPESFKTEFTGWYNNNNIPSKYSNPVICHNGDERVISWQNTTIYDDSGNIVQTTSVGEDITDQQKDRQSLISAKEKAERSSLFKSEFLSTMSHEIRTPMNAVIGTTNLLLEENPRADQLPYLNNLKFSGENLLGIIDDILDYNKIEAGKLELSKTALNVHSLAANIKQSFQAKAMEKNLDITLEIDQDIPQNLIGDPIRLGQILNNLLSNGIKFTHKGGVTILIREEARDDKYITLNFTVADTGIGIEQGSLDKIFEPFVQETHHRNYGGSGLGLAIINRLIELHNSTISVSSALGKGTQFNFAIEFEYTAQPVSKPKLNPVQKMQEANLEGMKVLVVDDNKMNILIASRFLNKWNITISEAHNGLVATEMVESNSYDLIIMDLQMPVMDGFEATKNIKKSFPHLPIIALTADAMPETFTKARNCGMDDYLTKPFMPEILFEKVARHYKPVFN